MGWVLLASPPPCPPHCLALVWFQALVELCPSPERIMGMLARAQAPSQGVSAHLYHHQTCCSGGKSSSEDFTGIQHPRLEWVGILVTPHWWRGWMVSVWNVQCLKTGRDFPVVVWEFRWVLVRAEYLQCPQRNDSGSWQSRGFLWLDEIPVLWGKQWGNGTSHKSLAASACQKGDKAMLLVLLVWLGFYRHKSNTFVNLFLSSPKQGREHSAIQVHGSDNVTRGIAASSD